MNPLATSMLRSLLSTQSATAGFNAGGLQSSQGSANFSFARLLDAAKAGAITSSRPVEAAPEAQGKLTPEQLSRIAVAADNAETAGMNSALVLIDGQAVKLDVLTRQVTDIVDPRTVAVTGVDGVIAAPPSSIAAQAAGTPASATTGSSPTDVLGQQLLNRLTLPRSQASLITR